jgi:hypothetical protein
LVFLVVSFPLAFPPIIQLFYKFNLVEFEGLTAVVVKRSMFWVITPFNPIVNQPTFLEKHVNFFSVEE